MKADDIRRLDEEQMAKTLAETREELFNLRFQHATGALESTARIKAVRRDVARLLTAQRVQTPKET